MSVLTWTVRNPSPTATRIPSGSLSTGERRAAAGRGQAPSNARIVEQYSDEITQTATSGPLRLCSTMTGALDHELLDSHLDSRSLSTLSHFIVPAVFGRAGKFAGGGSVEEDESDGVGEIDCSCPAARRRGLPASAQITTGNITGTVKDAQGGVVPGATVTLIDEAQGTKLAPATTDETGAYTFPNVTAATYTVEVTMSGFKTAVRKGVPVSGGDRVSVPPITLEVGGADRSGHGHRRSRR